MTGDDGFDVVAEAAAGLAGGGWRVEVLSSKTKRAGSGGNLSPSGSGPIVWWFKIPSREGTRATGAPRHRSAAEHYFVKPHGLKVCGARLRQAPRPVRTSRPTARPLRLAEPNVRRGERGPPTSVFALLPTFRSASPIVRASVRDLMRPNRTSPAGMMANLPNPNPSPWRIVPPGFSSPACRVGIEVKLIISSSIAAPNHGFPNLLKFFENLISYGSALYGSNDCHCG